MANHEPPVNTQPISQPLLASDEKTPPDENRQSLDSITLAPCSEYSSTLNLPQSPHTDDETAKRTNHKGIRHSSSRIVLEETDSRSNAKLTTKHTGKTRNILTNWVEEVLVLIFATGLLIFMLLILYKFHRQKQPQWFGFVTLNALIVVVATIFRASLAVIAFEIIGQVKWDWISRSPRPLYDIQLFDNATRGVPGSLRLLGLVAFRFPLVLVATILAIVSLGIGSFTQQAIQTYSCLQPTSASQLSDQSFVTIAHRVQDDNILRMGYAEDVKYNESWQLALESAIVNPTVDLTLPSDLYNCPTGNCTFTEYGASGNNSITHASLGLCNRCSNVYDLVKGPFMSSSNESEFVLELPIPGYYGGDTDARLMLYQYTSSDYIAIRPVRNLTWAGNHVSRDMLNRERYAIQKLAILALSQSNCGKFDNGTLDCPTNITAWNGPTDYVAATCIIYPCMKYYHGSVSNNVLSEKIIRDTPLRPQAADQVDTAEKYYYEDWGGVQQPCRVNGTVYTAQNMSKASNLGAASITTVISVSEGFESENPKEKATYTNITAPNECVGILDGSLMTGFHSAPMDWFDSKCNVDVRGGPEFMYCDQWYTRNLMRNRTTTYEDLQQSIDSVTRGLTNQMRRAARGIHSDKPEPVLAQAWEADICINVAWIWLTFPAALCFISILLLVITLLRTSAQKRSPVWKNSVLPLLLKDHPGIGAMGITEVEQTAKGFIIKLHHEEDDQSMEMVSNTTPRTL